MGTESVKKHGVCNRFRSMQLPCFYKDIWDAEINSELPCFAKPDNREDRYAVAVMNGVDLVPELKGFQSTLLQEKKSKSIFEKDKVQVIHLHGDHWIVAATIEATSYEVKVYDSVFDSADDHTTIVITNLFGSLAKTKTVKILKQSGASDCGLYAVANATALCFGKDPVILHFNQALMRLHLVQCMEQKTITPNRTMHDLAVY